MYNGVYKRKRKRHRYGRDRETANSVAEQDIEIFILLSRERIVVGGERIGGRGIVASRAEYLLRTRP